MDVLNGVTTDYHDVRNSDLLDRWLPLTNWCNARLDAGVEPYSKSTSTKISPRLTVFDRANRTYSGVNLASQDYLSLSAHPSILRKTQFAIEQFGVHSAGSSALMGLTRKTQELETKLAQFLQLDNATVFPTGWAAGFGTIRTLVKENDHILLDVLSHACLQEAANCSTRNVHRFPHLSNSGVERRLERIRKSDPDAGILVVTETLFSMDSDVPNLAELQAICTHYNATLFVDVAHDLGAIGPTGRGFLEIQNMLGKIDIVMGSFSKTFASNGGFAATNHPGLKLALRFGCGPSTFSNALSAVQASTILACFEIIESEEGSLRREKLMQNALTLRNALEDEDFKILGEPSAIVPMILGDNPTSRIMTRNALEAGAIVNLVEYPAVPKNACRWRIQLMSDHCEEDLRTFINIARHARDGVQRDKSYSAA